MINDYKTLDKTTTYPHRTKACKACKSKMQSKIKND